MIYMHCNALNHIAFSGIGRKSCAFFVMPLLPNLNCTGRERFKIVNIRSDIHHTNFLEKYLSRRFMFEECLEAFLIISNRISRGS